jgi:putative transposase
VARLARISPIDIPIHIIQRGNNRQSCFTADEDYTFYLGCLKEYAVRYCVDVHAWVLMTNHVHLLCTPKTTDGTSRMMQALGRKYVHYFNKQYCRSGTLWEGRFKSCLVETERYLLEVYRYIELNPVRAGMVTDPGEYRWSSYQINGLGKSSELCTPHPAYQLLGITFSERLKSYCLFCSEQIEDEILMDIRRDTQKSMAVGSERFREEVSAFTGRRLVPKKRGRPVGWKKEKV